MSSRHAVRPAPRPPLRLLGVAVLTAGLAVGGASCGGDAAVGGVEVTGAWARTSAMDAANGAVYLTVTSDADDSLTDVSVDASIAARAELHETVMAGDMGSATSMPMTGGTAMPMGQMTMQQVDAIELPAGEAVDLAPGGYHVMLFDLAAPLEVGGSITVTLVFGSGTTLELDVPVRDDAP